MSKQLQIYVATSWRNPYHADVVRKLKNLGYGVYDFKNDGTAFNWDELGPKATSAEWLMNLLKHPKAQNGFQADFTALHHCDVCIMLQPCGVSAALELGFAIGAKKHTFILLDDFQEPELMLLGADELFTSFNALEKHLASLIVV